MILFACLLLGHIVADFYLQPYPWIMDKVKYKVKSLGLLKHIGVHTVITMLALTLGGIDISVQFVIALLVIVTTHYAIDVWKTYMGFTTVYFVADQISHIIVLIVVSVCLSDISLELVLTSIKGQFTVKSIAVVIGYLLAYKPLSILVQLLLRPYLKQFEDTEHATTGLQTAGEYIGGLERFLVITFVLLGQYAGIGFLLAAKSVFRFGDMRRQTDRKLTEYIMLGTLLSFTFALLIGLALSRIA